MKKEGSIRTTVSLTPDRKIWSEFMNQIKKKYGEMKQSAATEMLVHWFVENVTKSNFEMDISKRTTTINITLSVDYILWTKFHSKLIGMYGHDRNQSLVISLLANKYINDLNQLS
jgi:hypothetical protein